MIDFDTLLPEIMVRAPECPEPTAIAAIRDALTELCEECRVWRVSDDYRLARHQPEILMVPAGSLLVEIDSVLHDGHPLEPITIDEAHRRRFTYALGETTEWAGMHGQPGCYTQRVPNELIVLPHMGGECIHVDAYFKPGPTADQGPDWAMMEYRVQLRDGALMRILDIPGQPFSDMQRATIHAAAWAAAKARASTKWIQGQQRAPMRTRARFF